MTFTLDTWIAEGVPHLGLIEIETGAVRMQWRLEQVSATPRTPAAQLRPRQRPSATQDVIKQLFLYACAEDLKHSAAKTIPSAKAGRNPSAHCARHTLRHTA